MTDVNYAIILKGFKFLFYLLWFIYKKAISQTLQAFIVLLQYTVHDNRGSTPITLCKGPLWWHLCTMGTRALTHSLCFLNKTLASSSRTLSKQQPPAGVTSKKAALWCAVNLSSTKSHSFITFYTSEQIHTLLFYLINGILVHEHQGLLVPAFHWL